MLVKQDMLRYVQDVRAMRGMGQDLSISLYCDKIFTVVESQVGGGMD